MLNPYDNKSIEGDKGYTTKQEIFFEESALNDAIENCMDLIHKHGNIKIDTAITNILNASRKPKTHTNWKHLCDKLYEAFLSECETAIEELEEGYRNES